MPFRFQCFPLPFSLLRSILSVRPLLLCAVALTLFAWGQPSYATATDSSVTDSGAFQTALSDTATTAARPFASYVVQLEGEPVAALYASLAAGDRAQSATIHALTQAHLATVDQAQQQLVASLASHDAQVLYRVQRVYNGVAIYAPTDQIAAIAALPGVQAVYPLIPKAPDNARAAQLLNAPEIWEGISGTGRTGQGISIAIIDTGVDYLHTTFGGPGTGYPANDTNVIGDVPNFPGAKIVGGYDFAGDSYDASPTSSNFQPIPEPDPDPMDCYSFGHGTHVTGTAAGYGVRSDGTTYPGPYDSAITLNALRIGPGLAPEAAVYAFKVFGCTGSSNIVDTAIEWAVDPNQDGDFGDAVDIINLSLGSSFGASFDATTIAVENATKLGIIVVSSAGNTGDVHYSTGSPGMATGAIAVAATSIDTTDPGNYGDGSLAAFSARGPRRGDNLLKPDLAAPGSNIFSARRATGSQGVTSSGTSMASPIVAGIMALLRQEHPEIGTPGWSSQELKALALNTAAYPFLRPDNGSPYSLLRVGAGRIDPLAALQSRLIAYDAKSPEQVSVSFGIVDVLDHATEVRSIRLANKSTAPISVTVGYTSVGDLPGVTIDVGAGSVLTVPALGFATVQVTLTADASLMARRPDATRQISPPDSQPWVDEASGYVVFTPVLTGTNSAIHLPILALPRMASALTSFSTPIDVGTALTATFPVTLAGNAITTAVAPTATVPLVGVFALAHNSPPISEVPNGDPILENYAQADLRYVGTAGPTWVDGERMLYFALVSYGPWSTPLEVTYAIEMDIDEDDIVDYILENRESTDLSTFDFGATDDFVSLLESIGALRTIQGPLNVFSPTQYDTRPYNSNVMVLPLHLDDLGTEVSKIRYQVISSSRDMLDAGSSEIIDATPVLSLTVDTVAGIYTNEALPLFPAAVGDVIPITINRAAYLQQQSKGVLLLYLHNEFAARTQVLPVAYDLMRQYFPRIGVGE